MLTVATLKAQLGPQIAPGNDAEFLRLLQEADDRLTEMGKWSWTRKRINLTVETVADVLRVTLPTSYRSIVAVRVGADAVGIESEEFEFVPDGIGELQAGEGNLRLIDEGWQDVTDGATTETRRVYKVAGCGAADGDTLTVLAHYAAAILYDLDLLEDSADIPDGGTDEPRCQSVGALKNVMLGIIQEEAGNPGLSMANFKTAVSILENAQHVDRGSARQAVTFRPSGPGIRRQKSFL